MNTREHLEIRKLLIAITAGIIVMSLVVDLWRGVLAVIVVNIAVFMSNSVGYSLGFFEASQSLGKNHDSAR